MRVCFRFILLFFVSVSIVRAQTDTINSAYFARLKAESAKDSTIKDVRYICDTFKNGKIKSQHLYVKYQTDSIDRFWRVGKCFHYFENGNLQTFTDVDPYLKKHVGVAYTLDIKGDTLSATFWYNLNGKSIPIIPLFRDGDSGKICEMYPDKYIEMTYKKGIRKMAKVIVYPNWPQQPGYISAKIYYKKDGTVDKVVNKRNY